MGSTHIKNKEQQNLVALPTFNHRLIHGNCQLTLTVVRPGPVRM